MVAIVADNRNATSTIPQNTDIDPEYILKELGGCGRYQIRMSVIVHLIRISMCFSAFHIVIFSSTPSWHCLNEDTRGDNFTCHDGDRNCDETCYIENDTKCVDFSFDTNFNTFVSEFHLVCENDYIPNIINTINIVGILVGNLIGGQAADTFGRKPALFGSLLLLLVSHVIAYFSTTWQMLAAAYFCTGIGCGFIQTVPYTILSEYTLSKWRVLIVGFPTIPLQICMLAFVSWLIHDWKYLQLVIVFMVLLTFLAWPVVPESFRWHIALGRHEQAVSIIETIAKYNRRHCTQQITEKIMSMPVVKDKNNFTFIHLFKTKSLMKLTLLLMVVWASLDIAFYGFAFGLQVLSGNIYLNLFLFSITGIPSKVIAIWIQNRLGRRATIVLGLSIIGLAGLTAGCIQIANIESKNVVANGCVFVANAGIAMTWGPVQTLTIEIYPTVVRNIGFGYLYVVAKISAMVGPQLVYLNTFIPGIVFFVSGGVAVISIIATMFLPETKDKKLRDRIELGSIKELTHRDTEVTKF